MTGLGYAAVGTRRGAVGERDYNYGVAPQALIALRLTHDDKASLDLTAREYFVSNVGSGTNGGHDNIIRGDASFTWRIAKQRAMTFKVLGNRRDARFTTGLEPPDSGDGRHLLHVARPGPFRHGRLAVRIVIRKRRYPLVGRSEPERHGSR